jgi:glycosyltransferase involved in cell wall biosynthesis
MKVGIYNEASHGLGGADLSVVVLAEELRKGHQVDIVHHQPGLSAQALVAAFGCDLEGVRLRYAPRQPDPSREYHNPWRRFREARAWQADLSQPYDLCITFCHTTPPFCHAPVGMLVILFPLFDRPNQWPWQDPPGKRPSRLWRWLCRSYDAWEWKRRFDSYRVKAANSQFTKEWSKRWWGVDCDVFYPPVDTNFQAGEKADLICGVGRFAGMKKQAEMAAAFQQMRARGLAGWKFVCAGSLGEAPADREYLETVRAQAARGGVEVLVNADWSRIRALYESAKIFWHGTGLGVDGRLQPQRLEHFGIVTVEAMAAGCVPVVFNQGGQPEIVQHGVSGFLWNTLPELEDYTLRLAHDEPLRQRMAAAARDRAGLFTRDNYLARFRALVQPFLPEVGVAPRRPTSNAAALP